MEERLRAGYHRFEQAVRERPYRRLDSACQHAEREELGEFVQGRCDHVHQWTYKGLDKIQLNVFGGPGEDTAEGLNQLTHDRVGDGRSLGAEQKRPVHTVADVEAAGESDLQRWAACAVPGIGVTAVENRESQRSTEDLGQDSDVERKPQSFEDDFKEVKDAVKHLYWVAYLRQDLKNATSEGLQV